MDEATLRQHLASVEPDLANVVLAAPPGTYAMCRKILLGNDEPRMRANACYLGTMIEVNSTLIQIGLKDQEPLVRIAATRCLSIIENSALDVSLVEDALNDADAGVRKFALRYVGGNYRPSFRATLVRMAAHDPEEHLASVARQILQSR